MKPQALSKQRNRFRSRSVCTATCIALGVAACAGPAVSEPLANRPVETTSARLSTTEAPDLSDPPKLDSTLGDGQIVSIAEAFEHAEVDLGTLALEQTNSAQVRQYAQRMVTGHAGVEAKLDAVAENQNIARSDSSRLALLRSDADVRKEALMTESATGFERSYLATEIQSHEAALRLLDETLIPEARDPALKTALDSARVRVIEDMQFAKRVLAQMRPR
jgi:putative membrane protein